ncbi:PREDICTED: tripartite motif-containing protein 46-like [Amphimedon queenslandica]|uniref:B-box C-terminal domain-containing protein n=1 Tax=Amphimedon queenslandica TaxID=400682 RepID=A0AAN0J9X3_AMPQE|nr:PREDICTED: tripartite motif-containing protein 46-like [Amphimedon queenslandica]|eukprot:XP_019853508.1 PREDICTED: tripartite motif-containing protein 46-like [Amphimedon queenslandica]
MNMELITKREHTKKIIKDIKDHLKDKETVSILASSGFDIDSFTHDHLHCPSCGKYYDDPRTLPCLDSYCRECLEKEARKQREEKEREREREAREREESGQTEEEPHDLDESYLETLRNSYNLTPVSTKGSTNEYSEPLSNTFDCPQGCQCPTGISFDRDGDIDPIPPSNKFLGNMVKDVQLKNKVPAGKVLCGVCDGNVAVAVCNNYECANLPLCSDCLRYHKKTTKTKRHNIIYPETIGAKGNSNGSGDGGEGSLPPSWKDFERHSWLCDFHPTHPVDRYCYEHKQVICLECADLSDDNKGHRNCPRVKLIRDVVDEERTAVAEALGEIKGVQARIIKAINEIEIMKKSLTSNKNWTISTINEHCEELIADVESQRESLINQTKHLHDKIMAYLVEHQDVLKRISDILQRSIDFIGGSVNMAIPTEFMFLRESFHERLNYLKERYKNSHMLPSDVNDRIHLKLNDGIGADGALGYVFGAPFIENYTVESFPNPVYAQKSYSFKIQSRDICGTKVAGNLPMLEATICSVESLDPIQCFVKLNDEEGVYTVYFYPLRAGRHKVNVYCPQTQPLFVKGCPFYIDVRR